MMFLISLRKFPLKKPTADVLPMKEASKEGGCKKETNFSMCSLNLKYNFEANQNASVLMGRNCREPHHVHWPYTEKLVVYQGPPAKRGCY